MAARELSLKFVLGLCANFMIAVTKGAEVHSMCRMLFDLRFQHAEHEVACLKIHVDRDQDSNEGWNDAGIDNDPGMSS